ncbi:hypothetical protein GCM10023079_39870 [Streptomyces chitinivorans]
MAAVRPVVVTGDFTAGRALRMLKRAMRKPSLAEMWCTDRVKEGGRLQQSGVPEVPGDGGAPTRRGLCSPPAGWTEGGEPQESNPKQPPYGAPGTPRLPCLPSSGSGRGGFSVKGK